jgi:hypothetical protein
VTRIICGVDISSFSLEARIGTGGASASLPNSPEGIQALSAAKDPYLLRAFR